jgi:hypothetical protein
MSTTYTLKIRDLANQAGLSACKTSDLEIIWDQPKCADIVCIYTTGHIEVQIPEGCDEKCFYGVVRCKGDCNECDDQRIKICPCDPDNPSCGPCEICDPVLGCISKCLPGEFCDPKTETCVECDDEHPCTDGQVCVNGKCKCPPDKPHKNENGECVDCDINDPDSWPPCTICTIKGIVPIVCPVGVCDPKTDECVECLVDTNCDPNEECVLGECKCKPGYIRDPETGDCLPAPECTSDDDCKDPCQSCNHITGKCSPIQCPSGQVCVDGKCEDICDCNDPESCGGTKACVRLNADTCYCKSCTGSCATGCGEGCYCNKSTNSCEVNTCTGSCNNGTDCGKGCGCNATTKKCEPCGSSVCDTTCDQKLGCDCIGSICTDVPDGDDCTTGCECGLGYGCFKGKCVHCSNFTTSQAAGIPGCGAAVGTDEMTFTKTNCDIKVTQKTENCACPVVTINSGISLASKNANTGTYTFIYNAELRKGSSNENTYSTLPKLGNIGHPDIAENEKPTSGFVELVATVFYDVYKTDSQGRLVWVGTIGEKLAKLGGSLSDKDSHTFDALVLPAIGSGTETKVVNRIEITVTKTGVMAMPNTCGYNGDISVGKWTFSNNTAMDLVAAGDYSPAIGQLTSEDTRPPLWKWYKSIDGSYDESEVFRKVYVTLPGNGTYEDILYGPGEIPSSTAYPLSDPNGELWGNRYYLVRPDCGCTDALDLGKVGFCHPEKLFYEAKNCNTEILLKNPFVPCDVNQDITKWGYDIPSDVQAKYNLYLNGTFVQRFVHNKTAGMVIDGTTTSMFGKYNLGGAAIKTIKLDVIYGSSVECSLEYALEDADDRIPETTVDCSTSGSEYGLIFSKQVGSFIITGLSATPAANYIDQGSTLKMFLTKGTVYSIDVLYSDGCKTTIQANNNCCDTFDFTVANNTNSCGGDLSFDFTPNGGVTPISYTITYPDGNSSTVTTNTFSLSNYDAGTYSIKAVDASGCESSTKTVSVTSTPNITYTLSEDKTLCDNETTNITFTTSASGAGAVLRYRINGGTILTTTVPNNGVATFGPINSSVTYTFVSLTSGSCVIDINEVVTIDVVSAPMITDFSLEDSTICVGSSTNLQISTNAVGSIVVISGDDGSSYTLTTVPGVNLISVNPNTSTIYTVDSISASGTCTGVGGQQIMLNVTQGQNIVAINQDCSQDLTQKTYTFNYITSATDQNNNPLTVVNGNQIVVPLYGAGAVTQINALYIDGSCTASAIIIVTNCGCDINYTLEANGVPIAEGETVDHTIGQNLTLALLNVTGGSGSYTYSWSNGATGNSQTVSPLSDTTYTVTIYDNVIGCSETRQVFVNVINCTIFQITDSDIDFDSETSTITGQCCYTFSSITVTGGSGISVNTVNVNGTNYAHNYNPTTGLVTFTNPINACLMNGETLTYTVTATSNGVGPVTCTDTAVFNEGSACQCTLAQGGGNQSEVTQDVSGFVVAINLTEMFFAPFNEGACGGKLYAYLEGNIGTRVQVYDAAVSGPLHPLPGAIYIQTLQFPSWAIYLNCSTSPITRTITLEHICDDGSGGILCTTTDTFTILPCPDVCAGVTITSGGTATAETCNSFNSADGVVNMIISGGSGPYDITGDLSANNQTGPNVIFTGLVEGTYSGTITDDNGCTGTYSYIVGDADDCCAFYPSLTVDANSTNIDLGASYPYSCDTPLVASASGGSGNYSYSWSVNIGGTSTTYSGASIDPLPLLADGESGIFSVTVTDTECGTMSQDIVTYHKKDIECDLAANCYAEANMWVNATPIQQTMVSSSGTVDVYDITVTNYTQGDLASTFAQFTCPVAVLRLTSASYYIPNGGLSVVSDDGNTVRIRIDYGGAVNWGPFTCCLNNFENSSELFVDINSPLTSIYQGERWVNNLMVPGYSVPASSSEFNTFGANEDCGCN